MAGLRHKPPSLFELAARSIKENDVDFSGYQLPEHIVHHLKSAVKCANPKCSGVYFENKYINVKFVDCCGAYKLPLLQYLCSPNCAIEEVDSSRSRTTSTSSSEGSDREFTQQEIDYYHRRVVLTGVDDRFSGFDSQSDVN